MTGLFAAVAIRRMVQLTAMGSCGRTTHQALRLRGGKMAASCGIRARRVIILGVGAMKPVPMQTPTTECTGLMDSPGGNVINAISSMELHLLVTHSTLIRVVHGIIMDIIYLVRIINPFA